MTDLTAEEAFKYGSIAVGGFTGIYLSIKKMFKPQKKDRCAGCNLCKHKLFVLLELWDKDSKQQSWKCCNEYKTAVARYMVGVKLNSGKETIKDFVCRIDKESDKDFIVNEFKKVIRTMIHNYENEWLANGVNKSIVEQISVYHNINARRSVNRFEIEMQNDHLTITERLDAGLSCLITPYNDFMYDIKLVMNSLNGELKGDIFNGFVNDGKKVKIDSLLLQATRESEIIE